MGSVNIQNACKGNADAERAFTEILSDWSKSTVNPFLASAAKSTLSPLVSKLTYGNIRHEFRSKR